MIASSTCRSPGLLLIASVLLVLTPILQVIYKSCEDVGQHFFFFTILWTISVFPRIFTLLVSSNPNALPGKSNFLIAFAGYIGYILLLITSHLFFNCCCNPRFGQNLGQTPPSPKAHRCERLEGVARHGGGWGNWMVDPLLIHIPYKPE